jgi:hypothetical protein
MIAVFLSCGWQTNFLGIASSERMVRKMLRDYNRQAGKQTLSYWMSDEAKRVHKHIESPYKLYRRTHVSMEDSDKRNGIHIEQHHCELNQTIHNVQIFGE